MELLNWGALRIFNDRPGACKSSPVPFIRRTKRCGPGAAWGSIRGQKEGLPPIIYTIHEEQPQEEIRQARSCGPRHVQADNKKQKQADMPTIPPSRAT